MKKLLNSAFTMAEAILVMTILGIIATIMISTLKPAEFKEKSMQIMAKKVLSEIDVATTQILMNNTADGTFETLYEAGTSNVFNCEDYLASNKLVNLYKSYLTVLRKEPESTITLNRGIASYLLKDGASFAFEFVCDAGGYPTIFPGEINMTNSNCIRGFINFDINDNEPPNVWGKDRFRLPLDQHGIRYED